MRRKSGTRKEPAEKVVRDIRRATRKQYSAEEKIRLVLEGLRGEESIATLCRREGIAESLYYNWSKEFLEAGKRRLAGDTARAATSDEVKHRSPARCSFDRNQRQEAKFSVFLELKEIWLSHKKSEGSTQWQSQPHQVQK
jgi:transposase